LLVKTSTTPSGKHFWNFSASLPRIGLFIWISGSNLYEAVAFYYILIQLNLIKLYLLLLILTNCKKKKKKKLVILTFILFIKF